MSGIVLSASVRQNLLSLQSTADLLATTQNRLSTGRKVNTALDNPTNFFTAAALDNRASDISNLLDGIGNGVQVLQAANTGLTSLQKLVDAAKSVANQALQATLGYSTRSTVTAASVAGANSSDLRGTPSAFTNNTVTGAAIPGAALTTTKLSALTTAITAADSFTVNGKTIAFSNTGGNVVAASGATLDLTNATVGDLLGAIDTITGTSIASSISTAGAITRHSGTASDLSVTSTNSTAFAALGFTGTVTALRTGGGTIGTGQVVGNDNSTFLEQTVAGGAVTTYDVSGSPVNLQFRWGKTDSASLGAGHTDTWNMFYQVNPNATGTAVAWQNVGTNFSFASNGQMTPAIASITLTNATVNGVSIGSPVVVFGNGGVTQFADANGNVQVTQIQQDGFPAGQLQSVGVSTNGRIVGNYSNGRNLDLAEITLASFNGTNFLKRADGGAFEATDESGQALFGKAGTIVGSSLEGSNTDIADEFTKLIVTQQAYSANTKVITTSNTMVQDLLNVLR